MTAGRGPTTNGGLASLSLDLLRIPGTPGAHRFHDSSECPFGARIMPYDHPVVPPYPRRCNWCTEHDRPISS